MSSVKQLQEAERYLSEKVKVILDPLVANLIKEKPNEPVI